jgi:hypothetical protein
MLFLPRRSQRLGGERDVNDEWTVKRPPVIRISNKFFLANLASLKRDRVSPARGWDWPVLHPKASLPNCRSERKELDLCDTYCLLVFWC